jgi:hypothetical protein
MGEIRPGSLLVVLALDHRIAKSANPLAYHCAALSEIAHFLMIKRRRPMADLPSSLQHPYTAARGDGFENEQPFSCTLQNPRIWIRAEAQLYNLEGGERVLQGKAPAY